MVQIENTAANDNSAPLSKGEIFDAANEAEQLAPAVQKQVDATEGIFEKFGIQINLGKTYNPSESVQILEIRRDPSLQEDSEAKPLLERMEDMPEDGNGGAVNALAA